MKKLTCMVLVLLLVVLSGCGNSGTNNDDITRPTTEVYAPMRGLHHVEIQVKDYGTLLAPEQVARTIRSRVNLQVTTLTMP